MKLRVRSIVIDWQDQTMEVTDTEDGKHTLPLDTQITVTMVGYPDREEKTMPAQELGPYMTRGYIIEWIEFEEGEREGKG